MMDDPTKWENYRILVPKGCLYLVREKTEWYLTSTQGGGKIPIESSFASILAAVFATTHAEEDWIDRHSLQFRWLQFWYKRKKRREARLQRRGKIEQGE